jgi:hypothetical protein
MVFDETDQQFSIGVFKFGTLLSVVWIAVIDFPPQELK